MSASPLGDRARRALLDHVVEVGDAAETSYLEIKSEIDLSKTAGMAKVAKFLLGAANRNRSEAGRHLGGHAVMVLGAAKGSRPGVPAGTEPHELEDRLRPYLGASFPAWDLERLPAEDPSREVLFVVAAPPLPGQPPYPCRKNFQGDKVQENLNDGAIYVRGRSNTRPANSGEIDALVERALGEVARRQVELDVKAVGPVHRVVNTDELMGRLLDRAEQRFREALARPTQESPVFLPPAVLGSPQRMSVEERRERLERWNERRAAHVAQGRDHLLGVLLDGMRLSVTSRARFVNSPRLAVTFHDCWLVEYLDVDDFDPQTLVEPVLGRHQNLYSAIAPVMTTPMLAGYPVSWKSDGANVQVVLTPDALHPDDPWITDGDDFCLITDSERHSVQVSWTMTERGNDEVYRGEFDVLTAELQDVFALYRDLGDRLRDDDS